MEFINCLLSTYYVPTAKLAAFRVGSQTSDTSTLSPLTEREGWVALFRVPIAF